MNTSIRQQIKRLDQYMNTLIAIEDTVEARGDSQEWIDFCAKHGIKEPKELWQGMLGNFLIGLNRYVDEVRREVRLLEDMATGPIEDFM